MRANLRFFGIAALLALTLATLPGCFSDNGGTGVGPGGGPAPGPPAAPTGPATAPSGPGHRRRGLARRHPDPDNARSATRTDRGARSANGPAIASSFPKVTIHGVRCCGDLEGVGEGL